MNIRVTLSADKYRQGRDTFKTIREKPRCELQCPQGRPAKSRCKKCEFTLQFKYVGSAPGYDFVWANASGEKFKASYLRDAATDTLIEVHIEYESPGISSDDATNEPSGAYKDFEEWFTALGASPETSHSEHLQLLKQEVSEQLQLFDDITHNKCKAMRKRSPLRPPATEAYILAYIDDRRKKRAELEQELKQKYGLD